MLKCALSARQPIWPPLRRPADDAAWIMTHSGKSRLAHPAERTRGPLTGAADQYDLLVGGQSMRVEARKRMIDGARHVARREFVRFADVDEHADLDFRASASSSCPISPGSAPERLEKKSGKINVGSSVQLFVVLVLASANWVKALSA